MSEPEMRHPKHTFGFDREFSWHVRTGVNSQLARIMKIGGVVKKLPIESGHGRFSANNRLTDTNVRRYSGSHSPAVGRSGPSPVLMRFAPLRSYNRQTRHQPALHPG